MRRQSHNRKYSDHAGIGTTSKGSLSAIESKTRFRGPGTAHRTRQDGSMCATSAVAKNSLKWARSATALFRAWDSVHRLVGESLGSATGLDQRSDGCGRDDG